MPSFCDNYLEILAPSGALHALGRKNYEGIIINLKYYIMNTFTTSAVSQTKVES